MNITFSSLDLSDEVLHEIRMQLYHSSNPGYYIFKHFLSNDIVKHIIHYWTRYALPNVSHKPLRKKEQFYPGCPNYYVQQSNGTKIFYNNFWSPSCDEVTNEVSFRIACLRNQIEARVRSAELYPEAGRRCVFPRVVITRQGEDILLPHSDYSLDEPNKNDIDLRRTQATLYLSKYGVDYTGTGFIYTTNRGEKAHLGRDIDMDPGDLVIWKYSNIHEIKSIYTEPDQIGFMRMIFPPETVHPAPSIIASIRYDFNMDNIYRMIPAPILTRLITIKWSIFSAR